MTLLAVWKVLEEIVLEFRKKDITLPPKVMDNLNSAKVLINIMDATETRHIEANPKIADYLSCVEVYLISESPKNFSPETVTGWLRRLETASKATINEEDKAEQRFSSNLNRNQKWVHIKPLPNLSMDKIATLAMESNLSFRAEQDGQLLVYGTAEAMKEFIKKATAQTSKPH
jgi:hypothetical protein